MNAAGVIIGIISAVVSAGSAIHSGRQQKKAANRQAAALETQAQVAIKRSEEEAEIKRRDIARVMARNASKYAGQGLKFVGSVLNVQTDIREEGEKDVLTILERGHDEARSIRTQGRITRAGGRTAYTTGLLTGAARAGEGMYTTGSNAGWFD